MSEKNTKQQAETPLQQLLRGYMNQIRNSIYTIQDTKVSFLPLESYAMNKFRNHRKAMRFCDDYMYMGSDVGGMSHFKHSQTREYIHLPTHMSREVIESL